MEVFNIICGVCSILGLLVSLFTAGTVVKISKSYENVSNTVKRSTISSYVGRDKINTYDALSTLAEREEILYGGKKHE